jgi:hypothetical protein
MLVNVCRTAGHHFPEDETVHNNRQQNLRSHTSKISHLSALIFHSSQMNTDEQICQLLHINEHLTMDSPCDNYISSNILLHVTDIIQISFTID